MMVLLHGIHEKIIIKNLSILITTLVNIKILVILMTRNEKFQILVILILILVLLNLNLLKIHLNQNIDQLEKREKLKIKNVIIKKLLKPTL